MRTEDRIVFLLLFVPWLCEVTSPLTNSTFMVSRWERWTKYWGRWTKIHIKVMTTTLLHSSPHYFHFIFPNWSTDSDCSLIEAGAMHWVLFLFSDKMSVIWQHKNTSVLRQYNSIIKNFVLTDFTLYISGCSKCFSVKPPLI